jgi:hypothetical protein
MTERKHNTSTERMGAIADMMTDFGLYSQASTVLALAAERDELARAVDAYRGRLFDHDAAIAALRPGPKPARTGHYDECGCSGCYARRTCGEDGE